MQRACVVMHAVPCLQETYVARSPDRAPFVVQAATTRVWVPNEAG
ncbi:hypothetical protein ACIBM1_10225 [Streptomyces sp. NPDC050481]